MNKSGIYRYRLRPRVFVVLTGRQLLLIPDGPSFTQERRNCLCSDLRVHMRSPVQRVYSHGRDTLHGENL